MTDKDLKNIKFLKLEIKRTDRALCQIATESKSGAEYRELLTQTRDSCESGKSTVTAKGRNTKPRKVHSMYVGRVFRDR